MNFITISLFIACFLPLVFLRCHSSCKLCVFDDDPAACVSCSSPDQYVFVHSKGKTGMCKPTSQCSGYVNYAEKTCTIGILIIFLAYR